MALWRPALGAPISENANIPDPFLEPLSLANVVISRSPLHAVGKTTQITNPNLVFIHIHEALGRAGVDINPIEKPQFGTVLWRSHRGGYTQQPSSCSKHL